MDIWGIRQLNTNKLIRFCVEYLLQRNAFDYKKIHALCKLTWITSGYPENNAYIKSTKIPALIEIFDLKNQYNNLPTISIFISKKTNKEREFVKDIILKDSGFTNFYNAYRKSSEKWTETNFETLKKIVIKAYQFQFDLEREDVIKAISSLPKIPKQNNSDLAGSENLLTPLIFSLDKEIRFPLINGNEGVKKLLDTLKINKQPLVSKFKSIIKLIGQGNITNAIDIDRLGGELPKFVEIDNNPPERKLIKSENKSLDLKDENDIIVIKKNLTEIARRVHNSLTNILVKKLDNYICQEGNSLTNKFDVLVKDLPEIGSDLLIEVKSSSEIPDLRMAVGQLFDYSRQLENYEQTILSVFLPTLPDKHGIEFLNFYEIYILWIEKDEIYSNNSEFPFKFKSIN